MDAVLVDRIDDLLPQTQCTRCGYPACRPYADAMARGEAGVNRCPPGGAAVVAALADLLGVPIEPLDPSCGSEGPWRVARIDEAACIGCTLCIQACPVDAIVGAARHMHTVVAAWCSGCDLCLAPCPVDCITMVEAPRPWTSREAAAARERHRARSARLAYAGTAGSGRSNGNASAVGGKVAGAEDWRAAPDRKQAAVATALARARARRAAAAPTASPHAPGRPHRESPGEASLP